MNSAVPSPTPPFNTPPIAWHWRCQSCETVYKLSVTRRCLACTETIYTGPSYVRHHRRRLRRSGSLTPEGAFDYESWTAYNDWRRFRAAHDANPAAWKRRTERELKGLAGKKFRVGLRRLEKKRRIEFTEERRRRFVKNTYSCEKDCDYPSQCHQERWAPHMGSLKGRSGRVVGVLKPSAEGDEDKTPICALLPDLEPDLGEDLAMTSPESIDDDDEIINAYGVYDEDESPNTSQDSCDGF